MGESNIDNTIIVVIAPSRKPEKKLLSKVNRKNGDDWTYVTVDTSGNVTNSGRLDNSLFILINQCQMKEIEKILKAIMKLNKNVIVRTHQNKENSFEPILCTDKNNILEIEVFDCEGFSHTGDKPFLDFMSSFGDGKKWDEQKRILTNYLNDFLKKKTASDAHSLRSQILTPFVALHLALQDSFDEKGKVKENHLIFDEECKEACKMIKDNELKKKLDEFLKNVKDKGENGIGKKYTDLKTKVAALCEVIKVVTDENKNRLKEFKVLFERNGECKHENGLIGDFADELENAVEAAGEK